MQDVRNTAFGWILFSGVVALGLGYISKSHFHAHKPELPEGVSPGYFIEGGEEDAAAEAEMTIAEALNLEGVSASAGEGVFAKCSACHTVNSGGANGIGPNLYGIMGAQIAGVSGFSYSSDLAGKGTNWTWEEMDAWLENPRAYAAGTKMSFAGLGNIEDRASVMLYMNTLGSGIEVPAFTPATEEPAEGEETEAADAPAEGEAPAEDEAETGA